MQIHKATAEYLGKRMNRNGFYEAKASETINLHQHTQILMAHQTEMKINHETRVRQLIAVIDEQNAIIDSLKNATT